MTPPIASLPAPAAATDEPAPPPAREVLDHLTRATVCLADGDEQQACIHLGRYVAAQPAQRNVRYFYAELLFKLRLAAEARAQFEQTIAQCQEEPRLDVRHLIHCHGRLLTLAEAEEDEYQEQLQRGLGLYWLARARAQLGEPAGDLPVEAILCKAAACFAAAHAADRTEARPCWYLHEIWRQLGQYGLAQRWLSLTQAAAPFTELTPAERRRLALAETAGAPRTIP